MNKKPIRVMVLGASGMLGNAVFRMFALSPNFITLGLVRTTNSLSFLANDLHSHIICNVDLENIDSLIDLFSKSRPQVVINCVGVVKQALAAEDPMAVISVNTLLPHRLARLCDLVGARLVHISTDCVFSGAKGMYKEVDTSDAQDFYGRSKYLGEVDYPNAITLRTSIIGHHMNGTQNLIRWFLEQQGAVKGFRKAVFSGLPTVELAHIIRDYVIPRPKLHGVYHVSAKPISKYELLCLVANVYGKSIEIQPDEHLVIDRSLDSTLFRQVTNYEPKGWKELIQQMHDFQ